MVITTRGKDDQNPNLFHLCRDKMFSKVPQIHDFSYEYRSPARKSFGGVPRFVYAGRVPPVMDASTLRVHKNVQRL